MPKQDKMPKTKTARMRPSAPRQRRPYSDPSIQPVSSDEDEPELVIIAERNKSEQCDLKLFKPELMQFKPDKDAPLKNEFDESSSYFNTLAILQRFYDHVNFYQNNSFIMDELYKKFKDYDSTLECTAFSFAVGKKNLNRTPEYLTKEESKLENKY